MNLGSFESDPQTGDSGSSKHLCDMKRAVIIGGGLGGLATALRLAASNWRVTVCEQGRSFGGKMNSWEEEGFRFDTGPSLITMPWVFAELFKACGAVMEEHIELLPVSPLADYVFADGTRFTYSTRLPEWLEVIRQLEPRDVDGFLKFMELGARLFAREARSVEHRHARALAREMPRGGAPRRPCADDENVDVRHEKERLSRWNTPM